VPGGAHLLPGGGDRNHNVRARGLRAGLWLQKSPASRHRFGTASAARGVESALEFGVAARITTQTREGG